MQDKRKNLEVEIPKQQIESIQEETHLVSINLCIVLDVFIFYFNNKYCI